MSHGNRSRMMGRRMRPQELTVTVYYSCCISSQEHRLQVGVEGYEIGGVQIKSWRSVYLLEDYPVASLNYSLSVYLGFRSG